jgi:hypothetical protein
MDISIQVEAQIAEVKARVTAKDGVIKRTIELVLAREFDPMLAAALGKDAKDTLALLEVGALLKATLPIDTVVARGVLLAMGQQTEVHVLKGIELVAKAGDFDEGTPPTCKLRFEFDWAEQPWVFLGRNLSAQAQVDIRSLQTEMKLPAPERRGKGARA